MTLFEDKLPESEDDKFVRKIMKMNSIEILGILIESPEYLSDSYFRLFENAIIERYKELT